MAIVGDAHAFLHGADPPVRRPYIVTGERIALVEDRRTGERFEVVVQSAQNCADHIARARPAGSPAEFDAELGWQLSLYVNRYKEVERR